MKKFVHGLILSILCLMSLFFMTACETEELGSLKEVTRPYAGFYQCETITLGGRDMTDKFETLTLELRQDGQFVVSYLTAEGNEGSYRGNYEIDIEEKEITFSAKQGTRQKAFSFPYEKGAVRIDYNLFGTLLHAEFKMPT